MQKFKNWAKGRFAKKLLVVSIFVLLTIIFTYPAIFHLKDKVIGSGFDNYQMLGWQYIAKTQIDKGVNVLGWTDYWRYPVGIDFGRSFDSVLLIGFGLLLYTFSSNPVLVFNLSLLLIVLFSCILSFLYFEKITKKYWLGILGSVIYSFSFFVLVRIGGHGNFLMVGAFPFFAYSLLRLLEEKNKIGIVRLALSATLIFVASIQYFLILLGSLILLLPICLIIYRDKVWLLFKILFKEKIVTILSLLLVAGSFFHLFTGDLKALVAGNLYTLPISSANVFSANVTDYLLPNDDLPLLIKIPKERPVGIGSNDRTVYLGYVEIILAILFFVKKSDKKAKLFILFGVLTLFIASLGCKGHLYPYCYIYPFFPFKGIAESARFYIIIYLLLTSGILIFINSFGKKTLKLITLLVFALIILERIPKNFCLSNTYQNEEFVKIVKTQDSKAVLDLPVVVNKVSTNQGYYDLLSVMYKKPIVNGYIHWRGNTPSTNIFTVYLSEFGCGTDKKLTKARASRIYENLKRYGITTVVLHKHPDVYEEDNPNMCYLSMENIEYFLNDSELSFTELYDDINTKVLKIN